MEDENNCKSEPLWHTSCVGKCESSTVSKDNNDAESKCRCCKPTGFHKVDKVKMTCENGKTYDRDHVTYTNCNCERCRHELNGLNFVDV